MFAAINIHPSSAIAPLGSITFVSWFTTYISYLRGITLHSLISPPLNNP